MNEWRFKRDTAFRKQFFVPDSFAHPAKMDAQLLIRIVETYTKQGEVILDPMAGMGTTMLACMLGRDVVLVELEGKFCKMCRDNWEQVRMRPHLGSAMGECQIIQGDARNLEGLLADKIVSSPPYGNRLSDVEVDDGDPQRMSYRQALGKADKIITSPPYSNEHPSGLSDKTIKEAERIHKRTYSRHSFTGGEDYSSSPANIGNLKSDSYLSAMLQVYQQCHKVLKSGGLMILVTKNFIRNKKIVRLDEDTIKLCEQAGFKFKERHYRELPAQSFWRVIYKQKYPDAPEIKYEDVLVFGA